MRVLPIPDYKPDVSDFNAASAVAMWNVVPRNDGFGPFSAHAPLTQALPSPCRGAFTARKEDGTVTLFAGTADRLYRLDNVTFSWVDVSAGGSAYAALATRANWSFAQFNRKVLATHANEDLQVFDVETDSAFADLGGSPPKAAHVTVVNRFVVLSGLASNPRKVQWSGLNALTTWTAGTSFSDSQELPDGGSVQSVIGGEFGVIVQEQTLRRMIFTPGSALVFQIDRIADDVGTAAPYSLVEVSGAIYFYSTKGFARVTGDGSLTPIGIERVDRTFASLADLDKPQLIQAAADPEGHLVIWTLREPTVATSEAFTRVFAYHTVLDRWTRIIISGQYLCALSRPGVTLEGLDTLGSVAISNATNNGSGLIRLTVASTTGWTTGDSKTIAAVGGVTAANGTWLITVVNGTTIDLQASAFAGTYTSGGYVAGGMDALPASLDDYGAATQPKLAMFDTSNRLGFFTAPAMEAIVTTAEQSGISRRLFIRGCYPITDAAVIHATIEGRERMGVPAVASVEHVVNGQGIIPGRISTRHARIRLRIPAGTVWSFVSGVEPDYGPGGRR